MISFIFLIKKSPTPNKDDVALDFPILSVPSDSSSSSFSGFTEHDSSDPFDFSENSCTTADFPGFRSDSVSSIKLATSLVV